MLAKNVQRVCALFMVLLLSLGIMTVGVLAEEIVDETYDDIQETFVDESVPETSQDDWQDSMAPSDEVSGGQMQQDPQLSIDEAVDFSTAEEPIYPAEPVVNWYRVSYFDLYGKKITDVSVREGEWVSAPVFVPYENDLIFQYWYDASGSNMQPYQFGVAVTKSIDLVPYYLYANVSAPEMAAQTPSVMTDESANQLVDNFLHGDAGQSVQGNMESEQQAQDIFLQQDTVLSSDADAALIEEMIYAPSVSLEADAQMESPVDRGSVMSDEQVELVIQDIMESSGTSAIMPEAVGSAQGLEQSQTVQSHENSVMTSDQADFIMDEIFGENDGVQVPSTQDADTLVDVFLGNTVDDAAAEAIGRPEAVTDHSSQLLDEMLGNTDMGNETDIVEKASGHEEQESALPSGGDTGFDADALAAMLLGEAADVAADEAVELPVQTGDAFDDEWTASGTEGQEITEQNTDTLFDELLNNASGIGDDAQTQMGIGQEAVQNNSGSQLPTHGGDNDGGVVMSDDAVNDLIAGLLSDDISITGAAADARDDGDKEKESGPLAGSEAAAGEDREDDPFDILLGVEGTESTDAEQEGVGDEVDEGGEADEDTTIEDDAELEEAEEESDELSADAESEGIGDSEEVNEEETDEETVGDDLETAEEEELTEGKEEDAEPEETEDGESADGEEALDEELADEQAGDITEELEATDETAETDVDETEEEAAAEETSEEDEADEAEEEPEEAQARPSVEVTYSYAGELETGTEITVRAVVHGIPEGIVLQYQWQNNATGEYVDVPGATGAEHHFVADENNTDCQWRVSVSVAE